MISKKLTSKLRNARVTQHLSLRDVDRLSKGRLSNGFVSQVELGQVNEPTPPKLRALAEVLKLNYLELMILAGYITVKDLKGKL